MRVCLCTPVFLQVLSALGPVPGWAMSGDLKGTRDASLQASSSAPTVPGTLLWTECIPPFHHLVY